MAAPIYYQGGLKGLFFIGVPFILTWIGLPDHTYLNVYVPSFQSCTVNEPHPSCVASTLAPPVVIFFPAEPTV